MVKLLIKKLNKEVIVPEYFSVLDAYPNPFNPSCTLEWETPQGGDLLIEVYDLNGSKLTTLVDSYYLAGKHQFIWNASNFSNGIYFILYSFKDYSHIQKITLLK